MRETASVFAGFTLSEAQGYERRRPVATLRLEIACADTHRVLNPARRLRRILDQRAVGLALDGRFTPVSI